MPLTRFRELNGKECIGEIHYEVEHASSRMRLKRIFLEEPYRGKGYGRVIMENIIEKARNIGCASIVINLTMPEHRYYLSYEQRRAFFEHFGFTFDPEGDYGTYYLRRQPL
jgi:GNAT superfamily N-acetyltransferase